MYLFLFMLKSKTNNLMLNVHFLLKRLVFGIITLLGVLIYSRDIYVATTGANTNSGSFNSPYKTITYASQQAQPGDNIFVRQGTYSNASFGNGNKWNNENAVRIACSGTATQYITFQNYPGEVAKIKYDGNYGILIQSASYVKVKGFEVEGMNASITIDEAWLAWGWYRNPDEANTPDRNLATELGINPQSQPFGTKVSKTPFAFNETRPAYYNGRGIVANKSHHIEILNNKVYNCPSSAIRADVCDYITVAGNEVYNNTWYTSQGVGAITFSGATNIINTASITYNDTSTGVKMIIENNNVHDNENRLVSWNGAKPEIVFEIDEGSGIFLTRNNDELVPVDERYNYGYFMIRNNLSYKNGASGIVVHKTDKTYVEFNTVYKNGTSNTGFPGGIGINDINDVIIRNNISYAKPNKFALGKVGGTINNLTVSANILYNENGEEDEIDKIDNTNINNLVVTNNGLRIINPLLMNPDASTPNFNIPNNSPAVNTALASTFTTKDFVGNIRDANPDIGAYEYIASLSATNLSASNFKIYPIPAKDHIFIEGLQSPELIIYNLDGLNITNFIKIKTIASNSVKLDLSNLKPGIYVVVNNNKSFKIIKN